MNIYFLWLSILVLAETLLSITHLETGTSRIKLFNPFLSRKASLDNINISISSLAPSQSISF